MRYNSVYAARKRKDAKIKAVFFNPTQFHSRNLFCHYARIPEIVLCMHRARQVLKSRSLTIPLWLWGLVDNREFVHSVSDIHLMSFLCHVGLYHRLIRLTSAQPEYLVGTFPAVCVCARSKTFEKVLLNIISGMEYNSDKVRVYQRKSTHSPYFSLQYFSKYGDKLGIHNSKKAYFNYCISILSAKQNRRIAKHALLLTDIIEKDSLLSWFWPFLKRQEMKNIPTKLSHVSFC